MDKKVAPHNIYWNQTTRPDASRLTTATR